MNTLPLGADGVGLVSAARRERALAGGVMHRMLTTCGD
jgi:hypothetical protein